VAVAARVAVQGAAASLVPVAAASLVPVAVANLVPAAAAPAAWGRAVAGLAVREAWVPAAAVPVVREAVMQEPRAGQSTNPRKVVRAAVQEPLRPVQALPLAKFSSGWEQQ